MWRVVKNSIYRNISIRAIIILLLTSALLIICATISGILERYNSYIAVSSYLSKDGYYIDADGLTRKATDEEREEYDILGFFFNDEVDIKKFLPDVNACLVGENYLGASIKGVVDSEIWEYGTEMTKISNPNMEEGHWFTDSDLSKDNELVSAVITSNKYNIHAGDIVRICDESNKLEAKVKVIGVVAEGEELLNLSTNEKSTNKTADYRQMYSYVEKDQNIRLIVSSVQILDAEAEGKFGEFNPRVETEKTFFKAVAGSVVLNFEKKYDEKEKNDFFEYIGTYSRFNGFFELSEFNKNCKNYILSQLYTMIPIFICIVIVIMMASLSTSMVTTKRELRNYAIFYLCGLSWKKCSSISLYNAVINVLLAWVFCGTLYFIFNTTMYVSTISLHFGYIQFSGCIIFGIFFVVISWLAPLLITKRTSAKEIIGKSK